MGRRPLRTPGGRGEAGRPGYLATRGGRTVGRYRSLDAALDAVDHHSWTHLQPSRFWTLLLATINVGIIAAMSLIATAILR